MQIKNKLLFIQAKTYYGLIIDQYQEVIGKVGSRHIPILFTIAMLQEMEVKGILSTGIDIQSALDDIEKSDILLTEEKISKLSKRSYTKRTEFIKYLNAITSVMDTIYAFKFKRAKRKTKRIRKRIRKWVKKYNTSINIQQ